MRNPKLSNHSLPIDEFIFSSIHAGYNTIIIGERHGDVLGGSTKLAEIAGKLAQYTKTTGIPVVIFSENFNAVHSNKAIPLSEKQLDSHATTDSVKSYKILHAHGIPIYGLENEKTNPMPYLENAPIEKINQFLKNMGLFEKFINQCYLLFFKEQPPKALDEAVERIYEYAGGYYAYKDLAIRVYAKSDHRVVLPNQEFSSYVNQMPPQTISIVVAGSKHVPRAYREEGVIDIGMEERLVRTRQTIATFIIAPNEDISAPYKPSSDDDIEYGTIQNVTHGRTPYTKIMEAIDQQISLLSDRGIFENSPEAQIKALKLLKVEIDQNLGNFTKLFSEVLNEFLKNTNHFQKTNSKEKVPVSTVLAENRNILFSFLKISDGLEDFMKNLDQQYGSISMSEMKSKKEMEEIALMNPLILA